MEVVPWSSVQPHERRSVETQSEMLRATHALCAWSSMDPEAAALFRRAPPWIQKSYAYGGTLTREDEGADCLCFEARPINTGWTPRQPAPAGDAK